jgi:uncharacterized protein YbjT (DUF2867 family)
MRIAVVGGTGLIGSRVTSLLGARKHQVISISRAGGVDAITGEGLQAALAGVEVVVDVADTRALHGREPLEFFDTLSKNLVEAEIRAGVRHHVGLSIVGVDRLNSSYFRAKGAQEATVRASPIPFTIVRSTQFFELVDRLLRTTSGNSVIRVPTALVQPIASDEVAETLVELVLSPALNAAIELAGPEQIALSELARLMMSAREDPRRVIPDAGATFFGAELAYRALIPGPDARLARTTFADWLRQQISAD